MLDSKVHKKSLTARTIDSSCHQTVPTCQEPLPTTLFVRTPSQSTASVTLQGGAKLTIGDLKSAICKKLGAGDHTSLSDDFNLSHNGRPLPCDNLSLASTSLTHGSTVTVTPLLRGGNDDIIYMCFVGEKGVGKTSLIKSYLQ